LRQLNAEQLLHYFQVNSIGAVLLAKAALVEASRSPIATISAKVAALATTLGGWYGYRASKAALNMFMRTTAIEYKRTCPRASSSPILARQIRGYPAHFSAMFLQRNYSRRSHSPATDGSRSTTRKR